MQCTRRQPDNICYLILIFPSKNKACDCYCHLILIDLAKKRELLLLLLSNSKLSLPQKNICLSVLRPGWYNPVGLSVSLEGPGSVFGFYSDSEPRGAPLRDTPLFVGLWPPASHSDSVLIGVGVDPTGLLPALPPQPAFTVTSLEDFAPGVPQCDQDVQLRRVAGREGAHRSQEWTIVVKCSAHERRSSQPFLKLLHLDGSVPQETLPSLQPLRARLAETESRVLLPLTFHDGGGTPKAPPVLGCLWLGNYRKRPTKQSSALSSHMHIKRQSGKPTFRLRHRTFEKKCTSSSQPSKLFTQQRGPKEKTGHPRSRSTPC